MLAKRLLTGTYGREVVALSQVATPMIIAELGKIGMQIFSTFMAARLGVKELAGAGLAFVIYAIFTIVVLGILIGFSNLIAMQFGARQERRAAMTAVSAIWVGLGFAIIIGIGFYHFYDVLIMLGQDPSVSEKAQQLLIMLAWSLPGYCLFAMLRNFAAAINTARSVVFISLAGIALNVVINLAFFYQWFGLPMLTLELVGMAFAVTMTLQACAMGYWIHFGPRFKKFKIFQKILRPNFKLMVRGLVFGLPIAGTLAMELAMFELSSFLMGYLGIIELAAHQIAIQFVLVALIVPLGVAYAVTFRVSQKYGAHQYLDARRTSRVGLIFGAVVAMVFVSVFVLKPEPLISIFIDTNKPESAAVFTLAVRLLLMAALLEIFDAIQVIAGAALRGLGAVRLAFVLAMVSYWFVGTPLMFLGATKFGWGPEGVWWGFAAGLATASVLMIWALERQLRKLIASKPTYNKA